MAYKILTLFTITLQGSLTNNNAVSGKIASAIGSTPSDVVFQDLGQFANQGPSLTFYVSPNRLVNQAAANNGFSAISRANYIGGSVAFVPAVRWTFEWGWAQANPSTGAAAEPRDGREMFFGVDTARPQNGMTMLQVGHVHGIGWRVLKRVAGADNGDGTYGNPQLIELGRGGPAVLPAGNYALIMTQDPTTGFYELKVDGVVTVGGIDASPPSLSGKRIGMWIPNSFGTTNATTHGFAGPMVLKSYTPKTGGGPGIDAGARNPAPARTAAPIRQAA